MGRVSTSVSISSENAKYLKDNKLSPSDLLNKYVSLLRRGAYDEDRETIIDEMVERFFKGGRGRTFAQCRDWIQSPSWKEELRSMGLTPLGFVSICRKRVESMNENGIDPRLQVMVGIIDELPPSAIKVPGLSNARRRFIENQEALALQWKKDQEGEMTNEGAAD